MRLKPFLAMNPPGENDLRDRRTGLIRPRIWGGYTNGSIHQSEVPTPYEGQLKALQYYVSKGKRTEALNVARFFHVELCAKTARTDYSLEMTIEFISATALLERTVSPLDSLIYKWLCRLQENVSSRRFNRDEPEICPKHSGRYTWECWTIKMLGIRMGWGVTGTTHWYYNRRGVSVMMENYGRERESMPRLTMCVCECDNVDQAV